MTEKQNSAKLCSKYQRRKQIPYTEIVVVSIKTGKLSMKVRYESVKVIWKQQLASLKTHCLKNVLNNSNSLPPAINVPNYWWSFSSQHAYDQNSVLKLVKIEKFSLCKKRCATTKKAKSRLMILKTLQFILFCVQKMILYHSVARIPRRLFLLMTFCTSLMTRTSYPMEILIVVLLSTLKLLQKSGRSNENGITFPDAVKNPSAFPVTIGRSAYLFLWWAA